MFEIHQCLRFAKGMGTGMCKDFTVAGIRRLSCFAVISVYSVVTS